MIKRLPIILLILCGLLLPLALPMAPASADDTILTGLEAFWELDEESGTRYDAHGSNDLTDNNTVGYASGVVGNAASFVKANSEYLSCASNASLQTGNVDYTFAGWYKTSTTAVNQYFLSKTDSSSGHEYYVRLANSLELHIRIYDGVFNVVGYKYSGEVISIDEWQFFAVWHDAALGTVNLQLDDAAPVSAAMTGTPGSNNSAFYLAKLSGSADYFDGNLDQIGFWKRVLTADERTWLYNSGAGRSYAELVAAAATPTPTSTPTSTPTATATGIPAGTPAAYSVIMPSGQTGTMYATVSAGEGFAIVLLVAIVLLLGYQAVSAAAEKWKEK